MLDYVSCVAPENWKAMLAFATPPPPIEKAVEMGNCSLCNKLFEMRENCFYSKFQFVYCG